MFSFRLVIAAEIIQKIIVVLLIFRYIFIQTQTWIHVGLHRKKLNNKMLLTTVFSVITKHQMQMIIPEIKLQEKKNNDSTTFWQWELISPWMKIFDSSGTLLKIYTWTTTDYPILMIGLFNHLFLNSRPSLIPKREYLTWIVFSNSRYHIARIINTASGTLL